MDNNNRPNITTILIALAVLFLITLLVLLCARNPGGGAVLSMAVYTRSASSSARARLVRRQRRPGCCLVPAGLAIAASAAQVLCILGKLIGAVTIPWLGVLLPILVALLLVLMFAPVRRH